MRYRVIVLVLITLITLFFGYQMKSLKINSDIIKSLPKDDPAASMYKKIGEKYKGSTLGIIILSSDNLYSPQTIKDIQRITDTLQNIEGIESVTSLTNIINIKSDSLGMEVGKLVDEYNLPQTKSELIALQKEVESNDMYKGDIVSEDGKSTIIMFTLSPLVTQEKIGKIVKSRVNDLQLKEKIMYGGMPLLIEELSDIIYTDMMWLIPIVFVVLFVILYLSFRTFRGAILPLITVGISTIWTLGLMALLGYEITMIGGIIPVVMFAVGSAYAIHVVNHISENIETNNRNRIIESIIYLFLPVLLSSLTTMFGFISFIFGSYLSMIKDFGLFCAVGTFFSFLLAIVFIPTLISYFPNSKRFVSEKETFLSKHVLKPISRMVIKHPKYIFTFWFIIVILGVFGTLKIDRSTNLSTFFKKNSQTRISEVTLQEKFGGSSPIYVVFKGDIHDPILLQEMVNMSNYLKTSPFISNTTSVADLVSQMNDAMGEGKKIPTDRAKVEQLWFLLEGQETMDKLVSPELDEAIIQARFASSSTKDTKVFIDNINKYIKSHRSDKYKIQVCGMPNVYQQMDKSLLNSQLSSLAIAIVLVLLLVGFSLKSFKMGFYGIIPILATVLAIFGFMGFNGIALDVATVSVASVALGIGVDYSIHTITAFNHYFKKNKNINSAIESTIMTTGKSILINAISVGLGFSVLLFSQLLPMKYFGLLIALSMLFSSTGALTLLPVLLIIQNRIVQKVKIKKSNN
jgi:uncharacterized protein